MWLQFTHRGEPFTIGGARWRVVALDPTRAVCGCATQFLQIKGPFSDGNFLSMTGYAVILQPNSTHMARVVLISQQGCHDVSHGQYVDQGQHSHHIHQVDEEFSVKVHISINASGLPSNNCI